MTTTLDDEVADYGAIAWVRSPWTTNDAGRPVNIAVIVETFDSIPEALAMAIESECAALRRTPLTPDEVSALIRTYQVRKLGVE